MPGALSVAMPWGRGALRAGSICAAIAHTNRKARRVDGLVLPVCDLRIADAYSKCRRAPWLQRHNLTSPQSFGKALTGITALGSGVNPTRRHRLFNLRTRLCQLTEGFAWCHCNIKKWVRHGGIRRPLGSLSARESGGEDYPVGNRCRSGSTSSGT